MSYIKKKRRISVVMGVYNCAQTLRGAIESIISQTFTDWELIICDDNSSDGTLQIAIDYMEIYDNILVIQNHKNCGLPYTLNHCLNYAESEYIARMDGDDLSMPERFEKEVNFLDKHPEFAFVSCSMINFDEKGDWGIQINPEKPTKYDFIYRSPFCHAPVLMRRDILNKIGNYTVKSYLRRGQDYYLWHKFYKAGYIGYNLQEALYKMRDDKNAARRRNWEVAKNGAKLQLEVFNNLRIPKIYYYRILRNYVTVLLPKWLYIILHKWKINKNVRNAVEKNGN